MHPYQMHFNLQPREPTMRLYCFCFITAVTLLSSAGAHAKNYGPFRTGDDGWFMQVMSALAGIA
ncbi:hypothetical protein LBW87_00640 [Herbaspirillum seropedicae]|nr:hypothetical protein [Herbaspirillum sp. alder98]